MPNYRIVAIHGKNRIEVQDEKGHKSIRRSGHVKPCHPAEKVCHQLPSQEVYEQYGRTSKLLIHPRDIPHIPLEVFREQEQIEKSEDHNIELSLIDSQKELLVDNHDESRSRVGNENLVEDPTKDQSTVQVCSGSAFRKRHNAAIANGSKRRSQQEKLWTLSCYTCELHRN